MKSHKRLKTVLLDMDGVLWQGPEPVLDIQVLFDRIQESNLQVFCVTNNSTRTIDYHIKKLTRLNVSLDRSQIITSAEGTAEFIAEKFPKGSALFVIGEEGINVALERRGYRILEDDSGDEAMAVVVGLDRELTYRKLDLATRHIHRGAFFVGTNPDLTIPTPSGQAPGAGTIIKAVEISSGTKPYVIGKPFSTLFSLALKRADCLPEETLMIGDRLETDIQGAQQMGMMNAVVLTGISSREQAESWIPTPDIIGENAIRVIEKIGKDDG